MKVHFFMSGFRGGTMNLDKKLPLLIKTYPNAKIKKTTQYGSPCIKGENVCENAYWIKLFGKKMNSKINIDFYGFSSLSFAHFDISFDLDKSLVKKMIDTDQLFSDKLFIKEKDAIMLDNKPCSFGVLMTKNILPYFDVESVIAIEKKMSDNISKLINNLDLLESKTAMRPYAAINRIAGMSVGNHNNHMIIEDYQNEIDCDNKFWKNIMVHDESIYLNKIAKILVCKNQKFYIDCLIYQMHCIAKPDAFKYASLMTRTFLYIIKKQSEDIKKNILEKNYNLHYWKKLKKKIEILDLNFLGFYSDMTNMMKLNFEDLFSDWKATQLLEKYKNDCENYITKLINELRINLKEVQYAISNLSTPIHAHDESILQAETEKVNDRILMLSFIAMVVSAIGMIQSDQVNGMLKMISGALIFSLPILYYMFRNLQKRLQARKNRHSELKRQLEGYIKNLEQAKKEHDAVVNDETLADDFKKSVGQFLKQFTDANEEKIEKLKKKIK